MQVDWARLGRNKFESTVELLIRRQWDGHAHVIVPDGRGGDDGIDIDVEKSNAHKRIYQLKYYPDGFSGDRKTTRQKQIRKSYITAAKHQPDEWSLVVPTKLTPGERTFVEGLSEPRGPRISIVDQVELDIMMINLPDVYNYLERDQMRANAALFGQEAANLFGGVNDVVDRVRSLGKLADTMDPYWTLDFNRSSDSVTYSLRPKTSDAHMKSPVKLTVDGTLGPQHSGLAAAMRGTFGFGASDPVLLPADVVQRLTISGPAFIAGTHQNIEMQFNPISRNPHVGATAQISFETPSGDHLGQFEGEVTHIGQGPEGGALELAFYNKHLEMRVLFPLKEFSGEPIDVRIGYNLHKIGVSDAIEVLEINTLLRSQALVLKVHLEDQYLMTVHQGDAEDIPPLDPDVAIIRSIAEDLSVVQAHCKQSFQLPLTVTQRERINLRIARLLIEGHAVETPDASSIIATLSGEDSPELRAIMIDGGSLRFEGPDYVVKIGKKTMTIGPVYIGDPESYVEHADAALHRLDNGTAEGYQVKFLPGTTTYFRSVLVESAQPRHFADPPTPWRIVGIKQPTKPS
ncbi:hypothetical protein CH254_13180 [Rhodococcus sp. 06-412-2C]|uniref:hypothetical protein n=1 Tax=unclassified Rhodococcus (in: high G+C Gram-positive bacteria) TaxID=192944 RepID=UPI000B9C20D9|nr:MULTISPECIES: hypothetical protein [unclassified Rhodococcus (in: high G+C Gram-positive bacteria)]OZC88803.1 hypothetical protein CH254_13180 [Rhodococcus sp. 06-412-2C]OZD03168.1 hypothetical protein CH279_02710 [Rhodococcus sp. 06-412-2B]